MKPIIYEPHPVTPKRKAELLAQGYKIIDAQFNPEPVAEDVKRPRRPRNKTEEDAE